MSLKYTTDEGVDVYKSNIHAALDDYIQAAKEEAADNGDKFDLRKAPQSRWNAALIYIGNTVFPAADKKNIFYTEPYSIHKSSNGYFETNNNKYNDDVLLNILYIYIDLCNEYNKEISIYGFLKLCNLSYCVYDRWKEEYYSKLNTTGYIIYKTLYIEREESLSNKLVSNNQALGILGVLNHAYGWNMGQPRESGHKITAQNADEIAQKYGLYIANSENGKDKADE